MEDVNGAPSCKDVSTTMYHVAQELEYDYKTRWERFFIILNQGE